MNNNLRVSPASNEVPSHAGGLPESCDIWEAAALGYNTTISYLIQRGVSIDATDAVSAPTPPLRYRAIHHRLCTHPSPPSPSFAAGPWHSRRIACANHSHRVHRPPCLAAGRFHGHHAGRSVRQGQHCHPSHRQRRQRECPEHGAPWPVLCLPPVTAASWLVLTPCLRRT